MAIFAPIPTVNLVLNHENLEMLWGKKVPTAQEKGYPSLFNDMCYWVLMIGDEPIAYTGSLTQDGYALVGNTYVKREWRGQGLHPYLLHLRNESSHLKNLDKVTVINPIEESNTQHLEKVVSKLGYTKVLPEMLQGDLRDYNCWVKRSVYTNSEIDSSNRCVSYGISSS